MTQLNDMWEITPDGQRFRWEGEFEWPINPDSGVGMFIFRPKRKGGNTGQGVMVGIPPLAKGDPGLPPEFAPPKLTPLEPDDPTPDSMSWTELAPPTATTRGIYRLNASIHKGAKGDDGDATWDPTDLSDEPVAGQIPAVNAGLTGFDLVTPRVPEVCYPATVNNTASGNPSKTLAIIPIPSRPYPRRVRPVGYTVVTGEGPDVRVDLVARLNNESGGNIVGRCPGIAQTDRLTLIPGKAAVPAEAADTFDVIAAGQPGTVYIRTERQAGSVTYTTSADTSRFSVEVLPLP